MYYLFIIAIGVERLVEMVVSRRNANWSFANGG
jgi:methyltransferase